MTEFWPLADERPNAQMMIDLVLRYFGGVDAEDIDIVLSTLTPDCVFRVETHGVILSGHAEIQGMLERLWSRHRTVLHRNFSFVADPESGRIAAQFQVVNTELNGELTYKSNCNFFDLDGARFSKVSVYMAGPNTLERHID
ncbi:MAG: nuclear transport factor 2 family protein [Arenibacterium sp.]